MSMSVSEAVASRRSIRVFENRPVPLDVLRRVLEKARMAPSGCNFQPWEATVLTGEPLKAMQAKILASPEPQDPPEYLIQPTDLPPVYWDRLREIGAKQYESVGVARDDKAMREQIVARNLVSFEAPVVLLCHFPRLMLAPQWSDVGMWLQTVMLLLREEGLDSCPQEWLAFYARIIKQHIGVDDESQIFFCGLAIGYRDEAAPMNNFERTRVPLDQQVRFDGF